jgi:plasmid stabilization system protein ParE
MKIIFKDTFVDRLEKQIEFIALDNPSIARKFKNKLLAKIKQIPRNPYQYRKSIYFNDINIRDMIFKGYTIVFRITDTAIEVFGFVKYQNSPI